MSDLPLHRETSLLEDSTAQWFIVLLRVQCVCVYVSRRNLITMNDLCLCSRVIYDVNKAETKNQQRERERARARIDAIKHISGSRLHFFVIHKRPSERDREERSDWGISLLLIRSRGRRRARSSAVVGQHHLRRRTLQIIEWTRTSRYLFI